MHICPDVECFLFVHLAQAIMILEAIDLRRPSLPSWSIPPAVHSDSCCRNVQQVMCSHDILLVLCFSFRLNTLRDDQLSTGVNMSPGRELAQKLEVDEIIASARAELAELDNHVYCTLGVFI